MIELLQPAVAFLGTILLIVLLRPVAVRLRLTDAPSARKAHKGDMPLVGGIAIFLAAILSIGVQLLMLDEWVLNRYLLSFLAAALLLVVVGMWDDWFGLGPLVRFAAQIGASLIMVFGAGIFLTDLGHLMPSGRLFMLGDLAVPFTILVAVGLINAINMCDGLDGLSGNVALVSLAGLDIANRTWGNADTLPLLSSFAAAVAGFLVLNQPSLWRNRAWVFLGDAGSTLLGFVLIWNVVEIVRPSPQIISPAAALWFLTIPIFDTATVIIRRVAGGRSPFDADAEHLHHLFVKAGFSVGTTIAIICSLAVAGVGVGLLVTYLFLPDYSVALLFCFLGLLYLWLVHSAWEKGKFLGRTLRSEMRLS